MGRIRVTNKVKEHKRKSNIPITRIGKRQYLRRRFAHVRAVEVAGANNEFTSKYFRPNLTAAQSFTRLGLTIDPSLSKQQIQEHKRRVPRSAKVKLDEENRMQEHVEEVKRTKIGRPVSEQEGTMLMNLIHKYKNDYKKMSLDYKLNPFQLNPRQLQRQVLNYLQWQRAAFPEKFAEAEKSGEINMSDFEDVAARKGCGHRYSTK